MVCKTKFTTLLSLLSYWFGHSLHSVPAIVKQRSILPPTSAHFFGIKTPA